MPETEKSIRIMYPDGTQAAALGNQQALLEQGKYELRRGNTVVVVETHHGVGVANPLEPGTAPIGFKEVNRRPLQPDDTEL